MLPTLTKKTIDASIEQFCLEQRAWVGLESLNCSKCNLAPVPNQLRIPPSGNELKKYGVLTVGAINAVATNSGKTPALHVVVQMAEANLKRSEPTPTMKGVERIAEDRLKSALTVPKGLPSREAAEEGNILSYIRKEQIPAEGVLAPNASLNLSVGTASKTRQVIWALNPDDETLTYALGVITYYDVWGTKHQTTFCFVNGPGGKFRFCPTGNTAN